MPRRKLRGGAIEVIKSLKRGPADETMPVLKFHRYIPAGPTIQELIERNSHMFLGEYEMRESNTAMFVTGGLRFGARYPDIIVDHFDYIRARDILLEAGVHASPCSSLEKQKSIRKIVDYVRHCFHTDDMQKWVLNDDGFPEINESWNLTIDKATECFVRTVYNCNSSDSCYAQKRKYTNTSTNVTALQYMLGDCREHAWLGGFLVNVYIRDCCMQSAQACSSQVRVFYTQAFIVNDSRQTVKYLEDHVFVVYLAGSEVFIIDPLYSGSSGRNYLMYDTMHVRRVEASEVMNYTGSKALLDSFHTTGLMLECGRVIVNNEKVARIVNVPKIYDGSYNIEKDPDVSAESALLLNRLIDVSTLSHWNSHDDWCNARPIRGGKRKRRSRL